MKVFECRRLRPNEEEKPLEFQHYRSQEWDVVEIDPTKSLRDKDWALGYIRAERSIPGQSYILLKANSLEEAGEKADRVLVALAFIL